jgi:uncharacterized protein DUF1942
MKVQKLAVAVAAAAIAFSIGAVAPASAADNIKPFGHQERLNDLATGAPMIGYTVTGLNPSSAPVPHSGQLYEAAVKVDAFRSWATPVVPMFNARSENGANYRVIADAGFGAVPPGGSMTGTLFFDVVGEAPNSVVYNDGVRDILAWVPGERQEGTRQ